MVHNRLVYWFNNNNNNNNNNSSVVTMFGPTFQLTLDYHIGSLSLSDIYRIKFILLLLCQTIYTSFGLQICLHFLSDRYKCIFISSYKLPLYPYLTNYHFKISFILFLPPATTLPATTIFHFVLTLNNILY